MVEIKELLEIEITTNTLKSKLNTSNRIYKDWLITRNGNTITEPFDKIKHRRDQEKTLVVFKYGFDGYEILQDLTYDDVSSLTGHQKPYIISKNKEKGGIFILKDLLLSATDEITKDNVK